MVRSPAMKPGRSTLKRFANIAGISLTIASLVFVIILFWEHRDWWATWEPPWWFWPVLACCAVLYGAAILLLVWCWFRLLIWTGSEQATWRSSWIAYGKSILAKYLPGNVFHLTGRHVIAVSYGYRHGSLVGAALGELLLLCVAGGLIGLFGFAVFEPRAPSVTVIIRLAAATVAGIAGLLLLVFAAQYFSARESLPLSRGSFWSTLAGTLPVLGVYGVFLALAGALLAVLAMSICGGETLQVAGWIITTYSIAWVVGLITPGAPAGMGVREAVLIALLPSTISQPQSLALVLWLRVVTVGGEVLFYLATLFLTRSPERNSRDSENTFVQ